MTDPAQPLRDLEKQHDFFIAIDSDGCAFDAMEIKHKECFIPNTINYWELQSISRYAREAAEFVNLYSKWRGCNRFPGLVMVIDLLAERDEVIQRGTELPDITSLRTWLEEESRPGNPALKQAVEKTGDPVLAQTLKWSEAVNRTVADIVRGVPPFPFVKESIQKLSEQAEVIVCSSTPIEALDREWNEHGLAGYVDVIAGQEQGKKSEHISLAASGKYDADKILMIGDANGDREAAKANDALFYPINPGHEDESWERFITEAMDRFFDGTYAGEYEAAVIDEFNAYLPEVPPWKVR